MFFFCTVWYGEYLWFWKRRAGDGSGVVTNNSKARVAYITIDIEQCNYSSIRHITVYAEQFSAKILINSYIAIVAYLDCTRNIITCMLLITSDQLPETRNSYWLVVTRKLLVAKFKAANNSKQLGY